MSVRCSVPRTECRNRNRNKDGCYAGRRETARVQRRTRFVEEVSGVATRRLVAGAKSGLAAI